MEKFYYNYFINQHGEYHIIQLADLKHKLDFNKNYLVNTQLCRFYKSFLITYELEREIGIKFDINLMDEYFDFLYYHPQYIKC